MVILLEAVTFAAMGKGKSATNLVPNILLLPTPIHTRSIPASMRVEYYVGMKREWRCELEGDGVKKQKKVVGFDIVNGAALISTPFLFGGRFQHSCYFFSEHCSAKIQLPSCCNA